MDSFHRIAVIGLGYVGLPTAAIFADNGVEVIGVDVDPRVTATVNSGRPHFGEPDLDALVRRTAEGAPTPDLSYVEAAARAIAGVLKPGNLVVLESTSPVGTTERLAALLAECRPDLTFPHQYREMAMIQIAHCPERVLPGRILDEVVNNPRLIGGMTRRCAQRAANLYRIVVKGACQTTDARTAELAKLAENAYRDVNIAFANELSVLCERLRVNVWELIRLANLHPRVNILRPGPGVGGHCIAVDPRFIAAAAPQQARLIRTAREVNDAKPDFVYNKVKERAKALREPVIACFGLAYKKDVGDLRESPAVAIVRRLAADGIGEILVVEPHIRTLPAALALALSDFDEALERADIVLLLVDHTSFMHVDRERLKDKILIDTRGAW